MINNLTIKCNEKIKEIEKFYDENKEGFMKRLNFNVYDVNNYNHSEKLFNDFPILKNVDRIEDKLNVVFDDFCNIEYEKFKHYNKINLCEYTADTLTFHIVPLLYQTNSFCLYRTKEDFVDTIVKKILTTYHFIGVNNNKIVISDFDNSATKYIEKDLNYFINDVDYQLSLFNECIEFYNNLQIFKNNQITIFKEYVDKLADDIKTEKEIKKQQKREKLQSLDCIYNALNLYIDMATPYELKHYDMEIEKYKNTLNKVQKEMQSMGLFITQI